MTTHSDTAGNLVAVQAQIAAAAMQAGRQADDITLVAVSKTHSRERIGEALAAGHRVFGENRVQEAEEKWPELKRKHGSARLHLIGPLQRNKVKRAVQLFDVIETVDRIKLANALAREMAEQDLRRPCFIQINIGEEPQKTGIAPGEADDFIRTCIQDIGLPVAGLMCIPPHDEEPAMHFALLAKIARRNGLGGLSMGMSGDFEKAVLFGATHVRVGTAIFGARPPFNPKD